MELRQQPSPLSGRLRALCVALLLFLTAQADSPSASLPRVVPPLLARHRELEARVARDAAALAPLARAALLETAADAAAAARDHARALVHRRAALAARLDRSVRSSLTVTDAVSGYAGIAAELQATGAPGEALSLLRKAANATGGRPALDPATRGVLAQLRAAAHDCKGEPHEALLAFREGLVLLSASAARGAQEVARAAAGGGERGGSAEGDGEAGGYAARPAPAGSAPPPLGSPASLELARSLAPDEALVFIDYARKAARAAGAAGGAAGGGGPARRAEGNGDTPPPGLPRPRRLADALAEEAAAATAALLARGPWSRHDQLPKTLIPGLAARPWHTTRAPPSGVSAGAAAGAWPHLAPVAAALAAAAPALAAEFDSLRDKGLLLRETECIHAARAGGGEWRWAATNGPWTEHDADGCAADMPAACALLARLRAARVPGLVVRRASYSAIGPRAHLRPHCGDANAQLKFHVGLRVPTLAGGGAAGVRVLGVDSDEGARAAAGGAAAAVEEPLPLEAACTTLRVANETRAWREGGVLFFDDSFEHEVVNACDAERVVFQLVINHPQLTGRGEVGVRGDGGAAWARAAGDERGAAAEADERRRGH